MRFSKMLGKTLRQPPSDASLISHQLLVRAGFVRALEPGAFALLPLGCRVLGQLQGLVRRELARAGGQEIHLPALPKTAPAETLVRLASREIDSYRQLPVLLAHLTSRSITREDTRGGLFGASERPLAEIYALGDPETSDTGAPVQAALENVLAACDLPVTWAAAGDGHRLAFFRHHGGDQELVHCPACGYAAERSWAQTTWPAASDEQEPPATEIATPGCSTIAALAEFLQIPPAKTLKMVFYSVEGKVTCVVIRGDRLVDEAKLARVLGTRRYYASLEDELEAVGAVGGYASPIGLDRSRVRIVADPSVHSGRNYVSGANRPDFHLQNVNIPRDFVPGEWAELARIDAGDLCPGCGTALSVEPAFELGRGTAPSRVDAEYLDPEGRGRALWLSSWQLDLGRLLATIVEAHHDEYGIVWPNRCAPFDVHLVTLDGRKEEVATQAEALYAQLQAEGFSVLYDDRDASAGVKFNDADLIGIPLRLTVSKRSVAEGRFEVKWRQRPERLAVDGAGLSVEWARRREA